MKRLILILIINFIAIFSSVAQSEAVHKAFEEKFPNMTHVTWSNENVTEWQADFLFDGAKFSTVFTSKGTWIETIRIIKVTELPQDVRNSILTKFPHWEITELNRTEKAKSGISYEVNLKKGRERKNIAFKEDGSIIQ
jgi:hypothetical protein